MNVVPPEDGGGSTSDLRDTFAENVRQLLSVLRVRPKAAAERIGVPYKWLWRVANAGISRVSNRQLPNLQKLADFFHVPSTDDFWRDGLLCWLISSSEGSLFVQEFRKDLVRLHESQVAKLHKIDFKFIKSAPNSLGVNIVLMPKELSASVRTTKLNALVAIGKHDALKQMDELLERLIDEAYQRECGGDRTNDDRGRAKKSATA